MTAIKGPTPHRRSKTRVLCGAVVVVAGAFALLNIVWLRTVHPWIVATAPLNTLHETNSIIGYSWLLDGAPIHKENLSPLRQSLSFNGALEYPDGYFLRPFYPFLVSLASWLVGLRTTALAINYLSVGVLVVATAWFAFEISSRRGAAVLAGALAAVGTGIVVHLNDLSAHMLSFATYAVVTCVVFASQVWRTRRPFLVHLALGMTLALSALVYPTGFLLTVAYVLVALPHSHPSHVAAAAALGFVIRTAWEHFLNWAYGVFFAVGPYDLYTVDFGAAMRISLEYWLNLWINRPVSVFAAALLRPLADSLFALLPIVSAIGVVAMAVVNWRNWARLWFCCVFFALPYFNVVLFSPGATARGYLVYCSAFVLLASVGAFAFRYVHGPTFSSAVVLSVSAVMVACQAIWSLLPYFGFFFPVVAFYMGASYAGGPLDQPVVANLGGDAPLWRYVGGNADFVAAGGLPLGAIVTTETAPGNFGFAFALNAFLLSLIIGLAALWCWNRNSSKSNRSGAGPIVAVSMRSRVIQGLGWSALWVGVAMLIGGIGSQWQTQRSLPFSTEQVTQLEGERSLVLRVRIAPDASRRMVDLLSHNPALESNLFLRASGIVTSSLTIGTQALELTRTPHDGPVVWRLDSAALQHALAAGDDVLGLNVTIRDGTVGGWQSASAVRETTPPLAVAGRHYWPSMELRFLDRVRNTIVFVGY